MGAFQGLDAFGKVRSLSFLVDCGLTFPHRRWRMSRSGQRLAPYVRRVPFQGEL